MYKLRIFQILILIFTYIPLYSQVYHFETGEVIPNARAGDLILKEGIFLGYDAEIGVLVVPEKRSPYNKKLINIPVVKIAALDSAKKEPFFLLNGGPGTTNMWHRNFPDFLLKDYDVIMVGYRGVEGSVILDCKGIQELVMTKDIFKPQNLEKLNWAWQDEADRYISNFIDIEGYGMLEVIQDIDDVRKALNYDKINIYAFSYGTMLTQLYLYHYPEIVNKLILLGTRPFGYYLHDPIIIENKINNLVDDLKQNGDIENADFNLRKEFLALDTIKEIEFEKFSIAALQQLYSYEGSKLLIRSFEKAKNNDFRYLNHIYSTYSTQFTKDMVLGDYAVKTSCSLSFYQYDSAFFFPDLSQKKVGHFLTEGMNKWYLSFNLCFKKFDLDYQLKTNTIPTLFISGEYDFIAPYEFIQKDLIPYFKNSEFLIIPKIGHDNLIKNNSREKQNKISSFLNN